MGPVWPRRHFRSQIFGMCLNKLVLFFFSVVTLKSDVTLQDEFELNVVEPISCQNVNAKGI